ncbi:hypothetical protein GCK32_017135, partial [Trichostrongylus colubriformis]
ENKAEFFSVKHRFDDLINKTTALDLSLEKWTLNMPLIKRRWKTLIDPQDDLLAFLKKRITQRKNDIASGKHSLDGDGNDFVDAFFIKMEKDQREGRHPSESYKEDELLYDVFDLWIAGQETTTITILWGLMHLIKNPEFNPERYKEGGKALEQRVIPFGIGKRSCIGETLARAEIFLILANLISRYEMFEDPEAPIDMESVTPIGMMHRPKNFNVILKQILCF